MNLEESFQKNVLPLLVPSIKYTGLHERIEVGTLVPLLKMHSWHFTIEYRPWWHGAQHAQCSIKIFCKLGDSFRTYNEDIKKIKDGLKAYFKPVLLFGESLRCCLGNLATAPYIQLTVDYRCTNDVPLGVMAFINPNLLPALEVFRKGDIAK